MSTKGAHDRFESLQDDVTDDDGDTDYNNTNEKIHKDTYTIDEAISMMGVGKFQWRILICTGILYAGDSTEIMILSFLLPTLSDEWNLSDSIVSFIAVAVFFGQFIGSLFWPHISDKYGRKSTCFYANLGEFIFGLSAAFSPDIYVMIILRFLTGFCLGAGSVGYTLYAEYAPSKVRGRLSILNQSFWAFGVLFTVCLAWITLEKLNWRWLLIISSLPWIIILYFVYKLPKSVRWLYSKGQYHEAQELILNAAKINGSIDKFENKSLQRNNEILTQIDDGQKNGKWGDIFNRKYFKTSVLVYISFTMFYFGYYGIAFISTRYFDDVSGDSTNSYLKILITSFSEIPGLIIAVLIVDRIGRKWTLIICSFIFGGCMFLMVYITSIGNNEYNEIIGVVIVFFARMAISMSFIVQIIYIIEYYPTSIRNRAVGLGTAIGRTGGMATTFISQMDNFTYSFYLYGLSGLISFVATCLYDGDTYNNQMTLDNNNEL